MRNRPAFTLVELLVVLAIIGIFTALLLLGSRPTIHPHRRAQCSNNLKQISCALINYATVNDGEFPPAYTTDTEGNRLHSWRTLILPYLEQQDLYDSIDLSRAWDDPANAAALERAAGVTVFQCPSADLAPAMTTYLAVVGAGFVFLGAESTNFDEITDGTGQTLLVIDAAEEHAVHWMSPQDADEATLLSYTAESVLNHPTAFQAAFVDGHVQSLDATLAGETRKALLTIAGGETLTDSDF